MVWFRREKKGIEAPPPALERGVKAEGLWQKCDGCRRTVWKKDLEANLNVCPHCQHHYRISARERLKLLFDNGDWSEHDAALASNDPLKFVDIKPYGERLRTARQGTGLADAIIFGEGRLAGHPLQIGAMEFGFIGGSMGAVVGEKVTRAVERACEKRRPLIIVSCSGGARMMEGVISLMQMVKISAALARLDAARVPYLSVLTNPTTGGVTACYAMLGDLNIAEPGALIGFAGPRVIEQTIRQKLPQGFQRTEFLLEHGFLDAVVHRKELKNYLTHALDFCAPPPAPAKPARPGREAPPGPALP
ncbi:MAG: acetyl-CoA carboxylase, carboxyltransferase subunit beta [Terriglobia bacterium]